jgi:hypothetical protein
MASSDLDRYLGQPTAQVMLLGTFHFQDRGLDQYKPQFGFDVFSERCQREIADVVACLAAFAPTKVAVERRVEEQQELDASYTAYHRGTFALPADEVYQIGFRLAGRLGHERVYGVNVRGRYYEPPVDIEAHVRAQGLDREVLDELLLPHTPQAYARAHGQTHHLAQWSPRYAAAAAYEDRLKTELSLREVLLRANAEAHILSGHGRYLVDEFKVGEEGEYPGVDWVTHWYNRNLRIFANLQRITASPDERILLIIGGGHVPILRHCVRASPEYQLVEVAAFLR